MNKSDEIVKRIKDLIGDEIKGVQVHEPTFVGTNASVYLDNCIKTGWVSTAGKWVLRFEELISEFTGAKYTIAVNNGTSALRLALFIVGVRAMDEVIIPPLSFVATANAISHLGALPHFIDIEPNTLGMCPKALESRLEQIAVRRGKYLFNKVTGNKIKAVVPVHVFGLPAKILEINRICLKWNLPLVEDAAEALGSLISISDNDKRHCGCFGDIGMLSFNGNKIITTGGGGALLTDNFEMAKLAKHLSSTAKLNHPWEFYHDEIAWNDRLPNINAALGVSQIESLETKIRNKRILHSKYKEIFDDLDNIEILEEGINCESNYWLSTIRILGDQPEILRNEILSCAHSSKIFLRPSWTLINELPMYKDSVSADLSEAYNQSKRLINLPSSPQLIDQN
tara:strand:+ start:401 stop:1591 length:1191 start_codon:yes stop_codon:yes gene_type:complete